MKEKWSMDSQGLATIKYQDLLHLGFIAKICLITRFSYNFSWPRFQICKFHMLLSIYTLLGFIFLENYTIKQAYTT